MAGGTVVVTGGARGNGAAIAERLAGLGARVVVADVSPPAVEGDGRAEEAEPGGLAKRAAGGALADGTAGLEHRAVDVADEASVCELFADVGPLRGLVNNAGVLERAPLVETSTEALDLLIAVNLRGYVLCAREAARLMSSGGAIVNVASIGAHRGRAGFGAYAATKGAALAMTRALAAELAPAGVRVNSVSPGIIETPMNEAWLRDREGVASAVAAMPLARLGAPGDVAAAVAFLLSDAAAWITGTDLVVDGGELAVAEPVV